MQHWLQDRVTPPWLALGIQLSRRVAIDELRESNPLWRDLGSVSPKGFFAFMVERELIRIRRHVLKWPKEWWTAHWVLQRVRLTNVKRSDDRASVVLKEQLSGFEEELARQLVGSTFDAPVLGMERLQLAGDLIFTVALLRAFGTPLAIKAIRFLRVQAWGAKERRVVVEALVKAALKKFAASRNAREERSGTVGEEFCFTRAYGPPRIKANDEKVLLASGNVEGLRRLYMAACGGGPAALFKERVELAQAAQRGPRHLTEALMKVSGFGGSGFVAKEVVEDVKMSSLMCCPDVPDDRDWAVAGPGARRGCNRLKGRALNHLVNVASQEQPVARSVFLNEMRALWSMRNRLWPTAGAEPAARADVAELFKLELGPRLDCNDVQFQLCEVDKFLRALQLEVVDELHQMLTGLSKSGLRLLSA